MSDPFTRRKTQPTLATAVLKKKDPEIKTEIKTELPTDKVKRCTFIAKTKYVMFLSTLQVKVNKENEYSDKPEAKVKVECEAQDLFNAHDFDITIDLGMRVNSKFAWFD